MKLAARNPAVKTIVCDDHAHTARAAMNPHWLVASGSDRLEKKAAVMGQAVLIGDVSGALRRGYLPEAVVEVSP